MTIASFLYAAVARRRREWYATRPGSRRRLERPVISIGNVAVGGRGKTPAVAHVARLLVDAGERPSILTRGYARARPSAGVTVVSDGVRMLADIDRAGDEPLMLARQLPSVPVLVSGDRHLAGVLAERRFGCTVHVLDDGFQHFQLERDVDLVLVSPEDVEQPFTLPAGRLREPLDVVRRASAAIVATAESGQATAVGAALGVPTVFRLRRYLERPRLVEPAGRVVSPAAGTRVLAVAGLARPERFFADLAGEGWTVAGQMPFDDHHRYTPEDLARIVTEMRAVRAVMVVTTEKDLVRLLPLRPLPVPVAWAPMQVSIEPAAEFKEWLAGQLTACDERLGRRGQAAGHSRPSAWLGAVPSSSKGREAQAESRKPE